MSRPLPAQTDSESLWAERRSLIFSCKANPVGIGNKAWVRAKGGAAALVLSPVDGSQRAGEPHVVGQLAQLINVKEEWLCDFLVGVTGNKASFHLHLRPQAAVLHLLVSQVEPAGHGFFWGLLDIAVAQAFAFAWLPTAVTVLPGLPVGKNKYLATQVQSLILQGLLAQVFVGNMQGGGILEINLIFHYEGICIVLTAKEACLRGLRLGQLQAAPRQFLYVRP